MRPRLGSWSERCLSGSIFRTRDPTGEIVDPALAGTVSQVAHADLPDIEDRLDDLRRIFTDQDGVFPRSCLGEGDGQFISEGDEIPDHRLGNRNPSGETFRLHFEFDLAGNVDAFHPFGPG